MVFNEVEFVLVGDDVHVQRQLFSGRVGVPKLGCRKSEFGKFLVEFYGFEDLRDLGMQSGSDLIFSESFGAFDG